MIFFARESGWGALAALATRAGALLARPFVTPAPLLLVMTDDLSPSSSTTQSIGADEPHKDEATQLSEPCTCRVCTRMREENGMLITDEEPYLTLSMLQWISRTASAVAKASFISFWTLAALGRALDACGSAPSPMLAALKASSWQTCESIFIVACIAHCFYLYFDWAKVDHFRLLSVFGFLYLVTRASVTLTRLEQIRWAKVAGLAAQAWAEYS